MSSDSTVPNEEEAPSNQETGVSDTMEQEQQGLSAPKDQGPPVREIPAPKLNSHKVVAANYNQRNPGGFPGLFLVLSGFVAPCPSFDNLAQAYVV